MSVTLADARIDWYQTIKEDGGYCPCCDRWGKMYRRGINRVMAGSIVWLARHGPAGGDWVDVPRVAPRFVLASNQFTTMRCWGLCERNEPKAGEDKKFSGRWRVTDLGGKWAADGLKVPKYVWTYNDTVQSFEGPLVAVHDCLDRFSYDEVMSTNFQ
jgi:hypothetical protein